MTAMDLFLTRRQALRALGFAAATGILAACGGTAPPASPIGRTPQPTSASGPPASTSAAPTSGSAAASSPAASATSGSGPAGSTTASQEIVLGLRQTMSEGLEPENQTDIAVMQAEREVMDPLVARDPEGKLVPMLAESWSRLDDLTWQFNLRKGVKFHNGEDFNADSVKYTIEHVAAPDSTMKKHTYWGTRLKEVEVKDPNTVLFHTTVPFGTLLPVLTITDMEPPKLAQSDPTYYNKTVVGTGPFKWTEYVKDQSLTLTANPDYWGGAPKLSKVTIRFIPEESTRIAAFKAGEVAIADGVPPEEVDNINQLSNAGVVSATTYQQIAIGFNCSKPPFDKVEVRQAMNYAVDKDTIVKNFFQDRGSVSIAPIAATVFGAAKQPPYEYNPSKAKDLLNQAGVSGINIMIDIDPSISKGSEVVQFITSQLQAVGINAKPNQVDGTAWSARRVNGTFDSSLLTVSSVTGDADLHMALIYFSMLNATTPNRARYSNPQVDADITKGASTLDDQGRLTAYADADRLIWQDAPSIWLYDTQALWAVGKNVQGFQGRPDTFTLLRGVSLA